jgi:5S rRNA maturation endonuclease (ribonuclease M5)
MAESLDLFNEVRLLRARVEELGAMTETLVRSQSKELAGAILERLRGDEALAEVFLLTDGDRTQGEILEDLKRRKVKGASSATVSRKCDTLEKDLHLIAFVGRSQKGKVYRRTDLDRVLGISRSLPKGR